MWKQFLGNGDLAAKYQKGAVSFNMHYMPLMFLFLCILPFVMIVDLFRNADLFFVSPKILKERQTGESWVFQKFRKWIHLKMLRVILQNWSALIYLILLGVVVWNPAKTAENRMNHWYNYTAAYFALCILVDATVKFFSHTRLRGCGKKANFDFQRVSKWIPLIFVTQFLLLIGLGLTFVYHLTNDNEDLDRANISGNHLISVAETFIAVAVFLAYFRFRNNSLTFDSLIFFEDDAWSLPFGILGTCDYHLHQSLQRRPPCSHHLCHHLGGPCPLRMVNVQAIPGCTPGEPANQLHPRGERFSHPQGAGCRDNLENTLCR